MKKLTHFLDQNPLLHVILVAVLVVSTIFSGVYFGMKIVERFDDREAQLVRQADSLERKVLDLQIRMTDMIPQPDTLEVRITTYSPTPGQCDDSPLLTATGVQIPVEYTQKDYTRLPVRLCAVSQDLLNYHLDYGDKIVIIGPEEPNQYIGGEDRDRIIGPFIPEQYRGVEWDVQDRTSGRLRNTIDLCVPVGFPQGCWDGKVVIIKK